MGSQITIEKIYGFFFIAVNNYAIECYDFIIVVNISKIEQHVKIPVVWQCIYRTILGLVSFPILIILNILNSPTIKPTEKTDLENVHAFTPSVGINGKCYGNIAIIPQIKEKGNNSLCFQTVTQR